LDCAFAVFVDLPLFDFDFEVLPELFIAVLVDGVPDMLDPLIPAVVLSELVDAVEPLIEPLVSADV